MYHTTYTYLLLTTILYGIYVTTLLQKLNRDIGMCTRCTVQYIVPSISYASMELVKMKLVNMHHTTHFPIFYGQNVITLFPQILWDL